MRRVGERKEEEREKETVKESKKTIENYTTRIQYVTVNSNRWKIMI